MQLDFFIFYDFLDIIKTLNKKEQKKMDILKEMMMEEIQKKIAEFKQERDIFDYNQYQLGLILEKLKQGESLESVEKRYLEMIFD